MKYKHRKNNQKKPLSHAIPPQLIKDKQFAEIITIANRQSELTVQDRYLYGYALLQTQQKLAALITLWPLAAKNQTQLYEDCAVIARDVFNQDIASSLSDLSEKELHILFLAAQTLAPHSLTYHTIKQHLCNLLWDKKEYEKLEHLLKSSKEKSLSIFIENMSKLAFFQAEKKLSGNIPALIGCVLTGAASFIARHPMYHHDIHDIIPSLTNEIKNLFAEWVHTSKQKISWDSTLLNNFIDYEAHIVTHILELSLKSTMAPNNIIPTPSYLLYYDAATKQISQPFFAWLTTANKELLNLYHADTHHALIFALGGDHLSATNTALKSINISQLNPYIRLMMMLRADNMKKSPLKQPVELSELTVTDTTKIYQHIAVNSIIIMFNQTDKKLLPETFWATLRTYFPVFQQTDLKPILLAQIISMLQIDLQNKKHLNLIEAKNDMHQLQAYDLEQQLNTLYMRQQECSQFLSALNSKQSSLIIKKIKNANALCDHLTLLSDINQLLFYHQAEDSWHHIKSLVENRRLNKFIPLKKLFDFSFKCHCPPCHQHLYITLMPQIVENLQLPIVTTPDASHYRKTQTELAPTKSMFYSEPNPFTTLDVHLTDTKPIIMQKIMQRIQREPEKMAVFRQAQNTLFHPARRFLQHYLRFLAYEEIPADSLASSVLNDAFPNIPFRSELINTHG